MARSLVAPPEAVNLSGLRARAWIDALGQWLLPPRCLLCDGLGESGLDLCAGCRACLPWIEDACSGCALPLPVGHGLAQRCGECLRQPFAFDAAWAAFRYDPPLARLLPRLKFHADLAAGATLARLMAQRPPPHAADAMLPVPLHRQRLASRGYNQALELARPLAQRLRLPLLPDALVRVRATTAQTGLDGVARRRNLREAFATRRPVPARVLLVDDVMTTGATLDACARALKQAGATWVGVWVAARVP